MSLSVTSTILLKLGEKSYRSAIGLMKRLSPSQRRKVARMLIQHGFAWVVAHNLDLFGQLDERIGVALVTAEQDLAGHVARRLADFGDRAVRERIIEAFSLYGQSWASDHIPDALS